MKRFGLSLAVVMVSLMFAAGGWAGVKSFVASYGLDSNACTQGSPCRSFAHAVSVTDEGGEVIVLDTGGYGSVTIGKSISLIAPVGMYASITPSSGTHGITINAAAHDKVLIKGLTIKGTPGSVYGIRANTVGTLVVDSCFFNELGVGVGFTAPDSKLVILNSKFNGNSNYGVGIFNHSGSVSVSMNKVEMVNNSVGFDLYPTGTGNVSATVTNSLAINNTLGFLNLDSSSGTSVLNLEHCIAHGNSSYGVYSQNNSATDVTRLSNCTITGNTYGVYRVDSSSGTIYTRQNNTIEGNETDIFNVSLTSFSAK